LSFIGLPFTEDKLIGYSYAFEQLTRVRDQGKQLVTPTTELKDVIDSIKPQNHHSQGKPVGNICIHLHK
jgi:hypothetical protein